jgi:drug/metabolite transporter (DMT)-like permease
MARWGAGDQPESHRRARRGGYRARRLNGPRTASPARIAAAAPALFVLLWSTGFVVARYGTTDAGPLTFLTLRLSISAAVLAVVATGTRAPKPSRVSVRWAVLAGLGMHAVYLGGVFVAIAHGLPTGLSALIAGVHPLVTSLGARTVLGERLRRVPWIGVGTGLAGVVLVVVDHVIGDSSVVPVWPLLAASMSVLGMSAGTLIQRKHGSTMPLLWGTVCQYVASALVLGVGAVFVEHVQFHATARSLFALAWAAIVLSLAAVLIMLRLLQRQAASKVSSLFFLTPALSTIEGAILFGERLGPLAIIGLAVALGGVALVSRPARRPGSPALEPEETIAVVEA